MSQTAPLLAGGRAIPVAQAAPVSAEMTMAFEPVIAPHDGLLVRERLFPSQMMCGALEKQLVFNVGAWNAAMPDRLEDDAFSPLAGDFVAQGNPKIFSLREEGDCMKRYCCHQWRETTVGLFAEPFSISLGAPGSSTAGEIISGGGWYGNTPLLEFFRPFQCTAVVPCAPCWMLNPQVMEVRVPESIATGQAGASIGRISMEWKWWNPWWHQMHYTATDGRGAPVYDIEVPNGCTNGFTNCCAPSMCNPIYSVNIRDATSKLHPIVGTIENQWPGCNFRGLCLSASAADNYVVKFPPKATPSEKALLVGALMLLNFNFFEARDNQKNNNQG